MIGTSSGLFQTCRYLGSILSSAVLGMLFGDEIAGPHFEQLGWTLIMISLIGIGVSLYFSNKVRGGHSIKKRRDKWKKILHHVIASRLRVRQVRALILLLPSEYFPYNCLIESDDAINWRVKELP